MSLGCLFGMFLVGMCFVICGFGAFSEGHTFGGVFFFILAALWAALYWNVSKPEREAEKEKAQLDQKYSDWIAEFKDREFDQREFAKYVVGFTDVRDDLSDIGYVVTPNSFVFFATDKIEERTRLDRDSIEKFDILDHTQFTKAFSMGALAGLGLLGLGAQTTEKHEIYYLKMDCRDDSGNELNIVLRSPDVKLFEKFLSYRKPYRMRLSAHEKKCPFCAEIIKSEAVKCRYCGSDVR